MKRFLKLNLFLILLFCATFSWANDFQVNVKSYGAKGDGVTDDTNAFNKAINSLQSDQTLFVPVGRYVIGKTISKGVEIFNKRNLNILGQGIQSQLLYYFQSFPDASNPADAKKIPSSAIRVLKSTQITISKISVVGMVDVPNPSFSYSSETAGIIIDSSSQVVIDTVSVTRMSGRGLSITSYSMRKNGEGASKNIVVKNSRFNENRASGIIAGNVDTLEVVNSEMNGNGQIGDPGTGYGFCGAHAAELGWPKNVLLLHNTASRNVRKGLDFHNGVNLQIIGNSVYENGLYGIDVEGQGLGGNIIIKENHIHSMGANAAGGVQITNDHPIVKAGYTYQMCAICVFYAEKGNSSIPDKNIEISDNIIENNTNYSSNYTKWQYKFYPFMIANFYGPNRDANVKVKINGNIVRNSDYAQLIFFGGDEIGDGSAGVVDFIFNSNDIEFTQVDHFNPIKFNDAKSVEFTNNRFKMGTRVIPVLLGTKGKTNDERISNVKYQMQSLSYKNSNIDTALLKFFKANPNSIVEPATTWTKPTIQSSGNTFEY